MVLRKMDNLELDIKKVLDEVFMLRKSVNEMGVLIEKTKKDLEKSLNIVLNEIKLALLKGENVELRDFGTWSLNTQKARLSRNPKSGEKIETPEKKKIRFKMSKKLFKKINNNE